MLHLGRPGLSAWARSVEKEGQKKQRTGSACLLNNDSETALIRWAVGCVLGAPAEPRVRGHVDSQSRLGRSLALPTEANPQISR